MKKLSTIASIALSLALQGCAESRQALQPRGDERVAVVLQAAGVQVYECRGGAWAFVAPEADLYDGTGRRVGRHFAGPTWESTDGSAVVGGVVARAPAASPDSIPWLLLSAKPRQTVGAFAKVTSIQRVDTVGGAPPSGGCDAANGGSQLRVPYAAQYVFFTR
jgi:hypothetical protein